MSKRGKELTYTGDKFQHRLPIILHDFSVPVSIPFRFAQRTVEVTQGRAKASAHILLNSQLCKTQNGQTRLSKFGVPSKIITLISTITTTSITNSIFCSKIGSSTSDVYYFNQGLYHKSFKATQPQFLSTGFNHSFNHFSLLSQLTTTMALRPFINTTNDSALVIHAITFCDRVYFISHQERQLRFIQLSSADLTFSK